MLRGSRLGTELETSLASWGQKVTTTHQDHLSPAYTILLTISHGWVLLLLTSRIRKDPSLISPALFSPSHPAKHTCWHLWSWCMLIPEPHGSCGEMPARGQATQGAGDGLLPRETTGQPYSCS